MPPVGLNRVTEAGRSVILAAWTWPNDDHYMTFE